jgi:NAD(P)-dependent dehydrogenase (short-subunit alcohol dehydrogenase family)
MGRLDGQVAIVTGAGQGIGKGIARRFGREGARVVVAELRAETGAATARELHELGAEALFVQTDVGQKADVQRMVEAAAQAFGRIDILVNNAQGIPARAALEEKTDEMLALALDTGVWGAFWAMQRVFPFMRRQGGGRIVNVSSLTAVQGGGQWSADYSVAKAAILGLTFSAAREWGRFGILVNALVPSAASGSWPKLRERDPALAAEVAVNRPLGRLGDPERDIGGAALFLASEDSCYVTGNVLYAGGGHHLGRDAFKMGLFAAPTPEPVATDGQA